MDPELHRTIRECHNWSVWLNGECRKSWLQQESQVTHKSKHIPKHKRQSVDLCAVHSSPYQNPFVKTCGWPCPQLKGWRTIATTLLQTRIQQVIPIPPEKKETHVRGVAAKPSLPTTYREEVQEKSAGLHCASPDREATGSMSTGCKSTRYHSFFFTSQKSTINKFLFPEA